MTWRAGRPAAHTNFSPLFSTRQAGATAPARNNGTTSQWFKPSRGLQQGCPASALLFALVVEVLAIRLRESMEVHGIEASGRTFKVSQYCDDTTLFVTDAQSAELAISIVRDFGAVSGLELNLDKCKFMWLGRKRFDTMSICGRAPTDIIKILGVKFSATRDCEQDNLDPVKARIKQTLDQWSQRNLTIKGKITVVKSLIVSQLTYLMSVSRIDEKELAVIQGHIMKFIWRGRPPKVAKGTLCMTAEQGGLKAPDLALMNRAFRIAWISRMLRLDGATFVQVLQERMRVDLKTIDKVRYDINRLGSSHVPEYYKEMILWFSELTDFVKEPVNGTEVRRQPLWCNAAIRVQGKSLFNRPLWNSRVKLIDDFVDRNGNVLSYGAFMQRHPFVRVNHLIYMGWGQAIPVERRRMLKFSRMLTETERQCKNRKSKLRERKCRLDH